MSKKNSHRFITVTSISILIASLPQHLSFANTFADFRWESPLAFDSAEELVLSILNAIITIAIPIVVLMIIYGGFMYVTAQGNAEQIKTATRTLTYAIIGGILIIAAVALTGIMQEAVCEFRPDGTPGCDE